MLRTSPAIRLRMFSRTVGQSAGSVSCSTVTPRANSSCEYPKISHNFGFA